MTFRSLTTLLAALTILAPMITCQAGVVSKSKWDRDFKFVSGDALNIQIFHLKEGKPEIVTDDTFKLTGGGFAMIAGQKVKIGGKNMFSALAAIESVYRRDSIRLGLETKVQISKQNDREIVFVNGEVHRPGVVTIKDSATIAELIEAAGGLEESADLERVSITHNGVTLFIDPSKEGDTKVMAGALVNVSRALLGSGNSMRNRLDELVKD